MSRAARRTSVVEGFEDDPAKGFSRPAAFIEAVMSAGAARAAAAVEDPRLRFLAEEEGDGAGVSFVLPAAFTPPSLRATAGSDEQGIYDDRFGGFAVGSSMAPGIRSRGFEGDPTAGRTTFVPMQTPEVGVLARTDADHQTSVSAGLTMARRGETVAITPSRAALSLVTLKASSLFGFAYATEELIQASPATFAAIVDAGFRLEAAGRMLKEKLRGLGGDQYLGVLNALEASGLGPTISVAAIGGQGADTIFGQNVEDMVARCWGYSSAIWIANHDTRSQLLRTTAGGAGWPLYQFSREESLPDTLAGRPVFYSEFASKLGDQGDLILGCWSEYLDGLYQPFQSAESIHARFDYHERALKFWTRNAGGPWWLTPLTPDQSSVTLSPFVVLDAR